MKRSLLFSMMIMSVAFAQNSPPAPQDQPAPPPPAPTALPTPAITGPLANIPPAMFNAGPFGKLAVNGFLGGYGLLQNNHVPGDDTLIGCLPQVSTPHKREGMVPICIG